jgi:hypothetical protein
MTPFEASGYTKDTKFIAQRDTVGFRKGQTLWLYRDDGSTCPEFTNGTIEGYMYLPLANINTEFLDLKVYNQPVVEQANCPNPPHKHADAIIEWAKGADIERLEASGVWIVCTPHWYLHTEYRVKPAKTKKQLEKEALQEQLANVEQETALLKQKINQLGDK